MPSDGLEEVLLGFEEEVNSAKEMHVNLAKVARNPLQISGQLSFLLNL